jgi:dolichyldiphosphatase
LFGSILASLAGKLLKRLLAHARPAGARKADPGMPSSHAVSLGYLSTYAALCCAGLAERAALQALGLLLTALRVVLGYHTVPQVVVGYTLGASSAAALQALAQAVLLPALADSPHTLAALYAATAIAVLAFAAVSMKSWTKDMHFLYRRGTFEEHLK